MPHKENAPKVALLTEDSKSGSAAPSQRQQASSETILRQWRLLTLLPLSEPGVTVTRLLEKLF